MRETTNLALWPQPQHAQISNDRINMTARASFNIRIVGFNDTEGILARAAQRYYGYIYQWHTGQYEQSTLMDTEVAGPLLSTLNVNVTGSNVVLDGNMDESYSIVVVSGGTPSATLTANSLWGAIRGLETFSQLAQYDFVGQTYFINALTVRDAPRLPYRAVMLDPARHFITIEAMMQFVDAMAIAKLNALHIHFIDSESWPVEIKAFPLLAVEGAWARTRHSYPQSSLKLLVAYARDRGVRIIPEMDFPSHNSLCKIYPTLCTLEQDPKSGQWYRGSFDPTSEESWNFYTTMWTELSQVFTDTDFHLGADEVNTAGWQYSPNVTAFLKKYADHCPDNPQFACGTLLQLTSYWFRRAADIVHKLGKNVHGWYPGLVTKAWNGTFPDWVVLDNWRGYAPWPGSFSEWQPVMSALVSTPVKSYLSGPFYVVAPETAVAEYNGSPPKKEEVTYADWMMMYKTDPLNFTAPADDVAKYMLGAEVAVWGDAAHVDSGGLMSMIGSIVIGVGENFWSTFAHPPPPKPWVKLADGQTAQGDDCPFTGRGADNSLGACEQACNQDDHCNVINYSPTIPDCVFRACTDPMKPQLTADSRYSLYTNQRQLNSFATKSECEEEATGPESCGLTLATRHCVWNTTAKPKTPQGSRFGMEAGACVASGDDYALEIRYLDARCRYQIRGFQMIRDVAILGYYGTSCPLEYAPPIPSM